MKRQKQNERGMALVLTLIALLIVTSIGLLMAYSTDTETTINGNYRDEQTAYYAAKAGLEEARDRMQPSATNSIAASLPTTLPGAAGGELYIINPTGSETVAPWLSSNAYFDDEICKEVSCGAGNQLPTTAGWYKSPALTASSTYAVSPVLPYKWMRISLKTNASASGWSGATHNYMYVDGKSADASYYVCWNGTNEFASSTACAASQAVYLLTSMAITPSGSRRVVQTEVTKDQISLTLPGALTIDGPIPAGAASICGSGSTCNASGAYITGAEPAGCTGSTVPAIAIADATSTTNLATAISANKANIVGSGGSPSVVNSSSALANLSTPAQIEALVAKMKGLAGTNFGNDCTTLSLGTAANPTITVVTNAGGSTCNLNSGTTGYGILVLTGNLQIVNVNAYQGVILMLGTAQFTESSSKDTVIPGALFLAQDRNPSTGALLATLGTPGFNYHHGNASAADPSIQYSQCLVNSVSALPNYKLISQREMMY
jgi:Tfp pilus assembly protein PilX